MPDTRSLLQRALLVGGTGAVRFGIDLDAIGRVLEHEQLPDPHRSVNVPRLLGTAQAQPLEDRYAEVPAAGAEAHLRLGPETTVESAPASRVEPVPRILDRTAARWAWGGLWTDGGRVVVVLDAVRLASIGAPTPREATR